MWSVVQTLAFALIVSYAITLTIWALDDQGVLDLDDDAIVVCTCVFEIMECNDK